ncbi:MAG: hypothetical protein AAF629_31245 [Chloroflexota bacterium]
MQRLRNLLKNRLFLAGVFIGIGVIVIGIYGMRSYQSYQQWQYIREQGLDRGTASIDAIAPWMTVRYVSVAYAVPQEYIFAELDIPYNRRNRNDTIGQLTREYRDRPERGERRDPILVEQIGEIILAYRENPVATGLNDVRSWMTVQYIANSTGIPADYIFAQLDFQPNDEDGYKPLDELADEIRFRGGPGKLADELEEIVEQYEEPSEEVTP